MAIKRYVAENRITGETHSMQGKNIAGIRADIRHYIEIGRWDTPFYFAEDWTITQVGRE